MVWFRFLDFFVLNFPVVVLIEKSEDLSDVLGLFLQKLVEDVEFSPFNLLIVVKIIGLQEYFLDFLPVQVL